MNKSWVKGRGSLTSSSAIPICAASGSPIQIGIKRGSISKSEEFVLRTRIDGLASLEKINVYTCTGIIWMPPLIP